MEIMDERWLSIMLSSCLAMPISPCIYPMGGFFTLMNINDKWNQVSVYLFDSGRHSWINGSQRNNLNKFPKDKALAKSSLTLAFRSPKNIVLATGYFLETGLQKVGKFHISEESVSIFSSGMYEC